MDIRVVWTEEEVLARVAELGGCVMLYSGGLDGTFFLKQVAALPKPVRCLPLIVDLGRTENVEEIEARAKSVVGEGVVHDARQEFADDYIAPAIRANGLYNGDYPLSASLSRPLLASLALRYARREGLPMVVHTSSILQNSSVRMTKTLLRLDHRIVVGVPSLLNETSREGKMAALEGDLHPAQAQGSASSDVNLWCEETETADEIDPETTMDPELTYPHHLASSAAEETELTLEFEGGLPRRLNDEPLPLAELARRLDQIAVRYNVGLFSGLEESPVGLKRLEVRRASGAAVLVEAHRALESATLDEHTLAMKRFLEQEWTNLASRGEWFSPLKEAIDHFQLRLGERVRGAVGIRLAPFRFRITGVRAADPVYMTAKQEGALCFPDEAAEKGLLSTLLFGENVLGYGLDAGQAETRLERATGALDRQPVGARRGD